ncbi:ascorbate-specific PTS system enzyme II Ccomponent [Mycoplasmopsis californica]|uniref:Ascorbate-specific PTS system EIIA component n=1 Tax=Mycoplasmopsis equigenitalium TaxID=114883 RepID=A0ABY5J2K2_9BACT|nr:PTS sugar transporter subunit IIA [Mycoplasmopsis equigenitalium]UUD37230.1 PTS sugar transporter subunit IIA [Mycoplasmopsis equigenitalium]VEU69464.1 ascorbate-specific PTS system enzyme II Ccomponent [Mycoplasmopsis californica]
MSQKLNLLDNLVLNDSIICHYDAKDWKDAIHKALEPLVDKKIINWKYYDAILESTKKHGPYYIITEGLAMPHASATTDSVFGNGFSLLTLTKPVAFENDERRVSILVALAAKDGETHTAVAIPQIIAVFENEENIKKIADAKSKQEIIDIIKAIDYTKYLS